MVRKSRQRRPGGSLPLSSVALYLLLLTVLTTGASLSRYVSTGEGAGALEVSPLVLSASASTTSTDELKLDASTPATYSFTVSNESDGVVSPVAFAYDVVVELSDPLPEGVAISLDGGQAVSVKGNTYTFSGSSCAGGTSSTNAHELCFEVIDSTSLGQETALNVTVSIHAEQTPEGGN